MTLESLDERAQKYISTIVDCYVLGYKHISDGTNPYATEPGITVQNSLSNYLEKPICSISLRNDNGRINISYVFDRKAIEADSKKEEYRNEERYLRIKKADTLYIIALLKWLYDSGHIFLIDDNTNNLFNTGHITEHDREKWTNSGMKFVKDTISSEVIFDFISKYYSSRIVPSPQLIDLKEHNFETPEQRRFKKQQEDTELALEEAKKANKLAKRANHISLGIAIGTVIITGIITWLCATFVPVSIHKSFTEQLNYRLDKIHRTDSIQSKTIQDIDVAINSIQSSVNRLQVKKNIKQDNNEQVENAKP